MYQQITAAGPSDEFRADGKFVNIICNGAFGGSTAVLEYKGQDGTWRPLVDKNANHLWTAEEARTLLNTRPMDLRLNFAGGAPNVYLEMR